MASEVIVYRGEKFRLQTSKRYFSSDLKNVPERLLHRRIWHDHHGPIPEGHDVHHRDENWRNNAITNLELKPASQHRREHKLKLMADPAHRAQALKALADNAHLAAAWHASPEGLEWHRQNSIKAWERREPVAACCAACGKTYETYFESRSLFCSSACQQRGNFARYKTLESTCAHCGVSFTANRHTKPECCSRKCGVQRRFALENATKPPPLERAVNCAHCSAIFTMLESTPSRTCSRSCRTKLWRAEKRLAAQTGP